MSDRPSTSAGPASALGSSPAGVAGRKPVIAIDGPAGAGKSTLAAHLARRFGFLNLETGAMYRALALKAIENDLAFEDEAPLLDVAGRTRISLQPHPEGNRVLLDGIDVSKRIRDSDVTSAASQISVHSQLRAWMVNEQRALGSRGGVVMEGRDIGTAVFPDAEVKIFLDAAPEVRGSRRYRQALPQQERPTPAPRLAGDAAAEEEERTARMELLKEMRERDRRDRTRADSPLRPAEDAFILDSTEMTLEQVLAEAERIVREHLPNAAG
ncbi:MAG: (d)CMP kinase [Acidobacteriaceae bacterium]